MAGKNESFIIRPAGVGDFEEIVKLWLPRKRDPDVMRWLHGNPDGSYRSIVADAGGRIVGHIGYVDADYTYGRETYRGVFTIEWLVDENYKQVALPLYAKVMKIGDFTFVIGGTEVVNKMYPLMKFNVPLQVRRFIKVVRPIDYFTQLKHNMVKNAAKTAFYARGWLRTKIRTTDKRIHLLPFDGKVVHGQQNQMTAQNRLSDNYFKWLTSAPNISSHPFLIARENEIIGTALCYVETRGKVKAGRIVHISHLGDNQEDWISVVRLLEDALCGMGCCIVSAMASDSMYIKTLEKSGYVLLKKSPFWLRDRKKIFANPNWHLTYAEGDLGYRNIILNDFKGSEL